MPKLGLDKVFETGIFEQIQDSWSLSSCEQGKLKVCAPSVAPQLILLEQSQQVQVCSSMILFPERLVLQFGYI